MAADASRRAKIGEALSRFELSRDRWHVIPEGRGKWSVKRETAQRAAKAFLDLNAAVEHARSLAREGGQVIVHRNDGTIRDLYDYPSTQPARD